MVSSVAPGAPGDPWVFCTSSSYSQLVRDKFLFLIYKRFKKQNKTKKWCSLETLPGRLGSPATVPHSQPSPFWGTRNPQPVSFSPPFCGQWALPLLPLADETTTKNLTLLGTVGGQGPLWGRDTDNFLVAGAETAGSPLPGG